MSSTIKGLVSKNKRRYKEDGFDLDLTYICKNLIAMGFPSEKIEGLYRNNIEDVRNFLELKHHGKYRIYNLCCDNERSYNPEKFLGSVVHFPFKDHNPPSLNIILEFCQDVQDWLSQDSDNVAAVHCKAGKGRTGVMICCYLLHTGQWKTANEALIFYAQQRTIDKKGVTIPSQQRYVLYYEHLLKNPGIKYITRPLVLREFTFEGNLNTNSSTVSVWIYITVGDSAYSSGNKGIEWTKGSQLKVIVEESLVLKGDVKVDIKVKNLMKKDKLCHFWFNTFFIEKDGSEIRNRQETTSTCTKSCVKFILRDPATVHSSNDNVRELDRTMSCPPPADTRRSKLPEEWTNSRSEIFSRCEPVSNPTLFASFHKSQLDINTKKLFTNDSDFIIKLGFTSDDSVSSPRCYRSNSDTTAQQQPQQTRYSSSSSSSNSSIDEDHDVSSESSIDSVGANVGRSTAGT